jgi:hypothetical protein
LWSDYIAFDLNFDGFGDYPYLIPGHAQNKDYHLHGFLFNQISRTVQVLLLALFIVVSAVFIAFLGGDSYNLKTTNIPQRVNPHELHPLFK